MPQAVAYFVGSTLFRLGAAAVVAEIGATAAFVATVAGISIGARKIFGLDASFPTDERGRSITTRSTIEPAKVVYGEALVSGPMVWVGTHIPDNQWLDTAIALTWHECEDMTDVWLDSAVITDAQINGSGAVTSGTFGPRPTTIANIARYLGTASQAADSTLTTYYSSQWTSAHQGKEIGYVRTSFSLIEKTEELWNQYSPTNTRVLVKGRKVYDPRLDTSPGANPTNPSYIAWSDNPALCLADFLTNTGFWWAIPTSMIDWQDVADAADDCDTLVAIPTSTTEKRYTCNGVLFLTDTPRENIERLLSSMNGTLDFIGDTWHMRAGVYFAPEGGITLDESWLAGPIEIAGLEGDDRFNTVEGVFIDPNNSYKAWEFPRVGGSGSGWYTRDHSYELPRTITLPFTNSPYMAQRIALKQLYQTDFPLRITVPCNLNAMRVAVGDRVNVDLAEIGWTAGNTKIFRVVGVTYQNAGDMAITLTLREDGAAAWADPAEGDYSVVSSTGAITFATARRIAGADDHRFDDFTGYADPAEITTRWTIDGGSIALLALVDDGNGAMGNQVLEVGDNSGDDEFWAHMNVGEAVSVELNVLYRVAFHVYQVAASSTAGMYLGVAGIAGDGQTLVNTVGADSYTNQHWAAALNVEPGVNAWNAYAGYFKRTGAAYAANDGTIENPMILHPSAHFVVPEMLFHREAEPGKTRVAYASVTRVENLGVLAALDTVGTSQIDPASVSEIFSAADLGGITVTCNAPSTQTIAQVKYVQDSLANFGGTGTQIIVEVQFRLGVTGTFTDARPYAMIGNTSGTAAAIGQKIIKTDNAYETMTVIGEATLGAIDPYRIGLGVELNGTGSDNVTATFRDIQVNVYVLKR